MKVVKKREIVKHHFGGVAPLVEHLEPEAELEMDVYNFDLPNTTLELFHAQLFELSNPVFRPAIVEGGSYFYEVIDRSVIGLPPSYVRKPEEVEINDEELSKPGALLAHVIVAQYKISELNITVNPMPVGGEQFWSWFSRWLDTNYGLDLSPEKQIAEALKTESPAPEAADQGPISHPLIAEAVKYYIVNKRRGITQEQVANQYSISVATLRRHIPKEHKDTSKRRTPKNKQKPL